MTKKAGSLLEPLKPLIRKAQKLDEIAKKIDAVIPNTEPCPWRIGNYEKGILTFLVFDAAFATQIKFLSPHLLTYLRKNAVLPDISQIKIKISPKESIQIKKSSRRVKKIDKQVAMMGLEHISDEKLKQALQKLSTNISS